MNELTPEQKHFESRVNHALDVDVRESVIKSQEFIPSRVADLTGHPDGVLTSGLAFGAQQQVDRLRVATLRYTREGYLNDLGQPVDMVGLEPTTMIEMGLEEFSSQLTQEQRDRFLKDGIIVNVEGGHELYVDKWLFEDTIPIVGYEKVDGLIVPTGSLRLILPRRGRDIPLFDNDEIAIYPEFITDASLSMAELSHLAVMPESSRLMASALLRKAVEIGKRLDLMVWGAVIDGKEIEDEKGRKRMTGVLGLMNGSAYSFGLPMIGPTVYHVGSDTTPVLIDVERALSNAESGEKSSKHSYQSAQFIRGNVDTPNYIDNAKQVVES